MQSGQCETTGVVAANACYKHVLTTLLVHAVEAQVQDFLTAHMHLQTIAGRRCAVRDGHGTNEKSRPRSGRLQCATQRRATAGEPTRCACCLPRVVQRRGLTPLTQAKSIGCPLIPDSLAAMRRRWGMGSVRAARWIVSRRECPTLIGALSRSIHRGLPLTVRMARRELSR